MKYTAPEVPGIKGSSLLKSFLRGVLDGLVGLDKGNLAEVPHLTSQVIRAELIPPENAVLELEAPRALSIQPYSGPRRLG